MPTWLIDCTLEVKRELVDARWTRMALKGCRFKGRFHGCEFGHRPDDMDGWELGGVEDCDFTEAQGDLGRFHDCDMRTVCLPKWPCFTILDPIGHGRELNSVEWPGSYSPVTLEGPLKELPTTVSVSFYAPTEAKRAGITEEEIEAAVERFDFIVW